MEDNRLEFLKKQSLMRGMSSSELEIIARLLKKEEVESGELIIEEGDETTDLYLIEEGEVVVLKWDEAKLFQLPIGSLGPGEMFGEMSFMDGSPRSSTIETNKYTIIYRLSRNGLENSSHEMQDIQNKIINNIAKINIQRLRVGNKAQVKTLRSTLRQFQVRGDQASIVYLITIWFGLLNIISLIPKGIISISFSYLIWSLWGLTFLWTVYLIRKFHYYLNEFGIGSIKLKKIGYEILVMVSILAILIAIIPPSFVPEVILLSAYTFDLTIFGVMAYFLYVIIYEFMSRCVIQNMFQNLLNNNKFIKAVIPASAFITVIPLFMYSNFMWEIFAINFVSNVILGSIYIVNKRLSTITLIHFFAGVLINYLR